MWLLSILITIAVLIILGLGLQIVANLESENRAVEAELHATQMYDEAFDARMKEMQRFRHDVSGVLQAIEHESEARAAGDGTDSSEVDQAFCRKSDSLVDALLALKRAQCDSAQIAFSSDVDAGWKSRVQERGIEEVDVQAVAQNLLQNAYEASLEVFPESSRRIGFRMGGSDGRLRIEATNRVASSEMPTFETTKSNPEQHGVGLKVVEDIATSYGGGKDITFDPQTRLLTVRVMLQQRRRSSSVRLPGVSLGSAGLPSGRCSAREPDGTVPVPSADARF